MSYPDTHDNSGCSIAFYLACGLLAGLIMLGNVVGIIADLTGSDSSTVTNWGIGLIGGLIGAVLFVWAVLRNPFVRLSLLVTGTAMGMIVLLLALNGGDKEALDTSWTKTMVVAVSVGVGALYLFWHLKRHPLD